MCKTEQPHRWQATISHRSDGSKCPYDSGKAVCPCDDLAHNHSEVAAEWDWETNVERTPETMAASSNIKAAWRCGLCGHRWSAAVFSRTKVRATECPQCARAASRIRQGSPASVKEHHTCWLSGTGMPMRHMTGTQTMLENSGLREAGALVQFHSIASSAQVPCPNHLSRF